MARIAGVDIPREKRLEISLTYIFGIGNTLSEQICQAVEVNPSTRVRDLTDEEVARLRSYIDTNFRVEGDLRRDVSRTSSARWRSTATRAYGTARACRCTASAPTPTPAPARDRRRRWPGRRR